MTDRDSKIAVSQHSKCFIRDFWKQQYTISFASSLFTFFNTDTIVFNKKICNKDKKKKRSPGSLA